jgi:pimeloyl-[acyl-carrier protein] methyl ester esterase
VVLLPGLDGTGTLFGDFISALSPTLKINTARYPTDRFLSYPELVPCVQEVVPSSRPFLLVAESFSTPLAAKFAATRAPNLKGLVMCAGFVTNPVAGWSLLVRPLARPSLFRLSLPGWALKHFLIGASPPSDLESAVRHSLLLVKPEVLARRIRLVLDCDARQDLTQTQIPILYIRADGDRLVGAHCFSEIRQLQPDTTLASISAPHLVVQREPKKAAEVIMRFIRELPD